MGTEDNYLAPRRYLREPIAEIFQASHLLDRAVGAHIVGNFDMVRKCLMMADRPEVRRWTESLWGSAAENPDQARYLRIREVPNSPPHLKKAERVPLRMPNKVERESILKRWGYGCAFCGVPVISEAVRKRFQALYPELQLWGSSNAKQHAAFQCLWLQYDHLLPHARGGGNDVENIAITCAPCNYGRMNRTLEEVGLIDPRTCPVVRTSWDGLERLLN